MDDIEKLFPKVPDHKGRIRKYMPDHTNPLWHKVDALEHIQEVLMYKAWHKAGVIVGGDKNRNYKQVFDPNNDYVQVVVSSEKYPKHFDNAFFPASLVRRAKDRDSNLYDYALALARKYVELRDEILSIQSQLDGGETDKRLKE